MATYDLDGDERRFLVALHNIARGVAEAFEDVHAVAAIAGVSADATERVARALRIARLIRLSDARDRVALTRQAVAHLREQGY